MRLLEGKRGLVVGIANEHSIATGCAQAFVRDGAELAVTYLNDKARPHVEPVATDLNARLLMPLDVTSDTQMDALFKAIDAQWGQLDFLLHAVAYCPQKDLHGSVVDCSREGFGVAMDVSVHSFIRLARRARPLMKNGGCLLTVSYYGAEKVVDHYNVMGPVKAALESTVKYMAAELGPEGIRVNAVSPGPVMTRAALGHCAFRQADRRGARPCAAASSGHDRRCREYGCGSGQFLGAQCDRQYRLCRCGLSRHVLKPERSTRCNI